MSTVAGPVASIPETRSERSPAAAAVERFTYNDGIVRMFTLATVAWAAVAMLVGLVLALQLAAPILSFKLPYITFGRLRPLHTNAAIFAFAGNAIFAAIYYSTQRLCKARMWSDWLGLAHFWGWQLIIVSAALTLPLGITQSKEYAELEWPIDLAITIVWVLFAVNFFGTLLTRRERHLYVAIWFYIATIVTVAVLHIFNNIWIPVGLVHWWRTGEFLGLATFLKSYPVYAGVQDAFMQWWYGHNAVAFFLTTPFLGMMYYFVPKAAGRPVYSYRLSIVHFWSLVFIYIWAGPHHLHYTALPEWASSLGMLFSLMLWMPSWGGMINGLLTLRGAWHKVTADPVLKFFVFGITFYGMSTFEGPLMSIKSVNALSHYTDWTIGHVHGGALGWNGFMTFGMIYWLLPRLFLPSAQREAATLQIQKLANWHFWLATVGILFYIFAMWAAGITQGLMWRQIDAQGNLSWTFIETVKHLQPHYWARALGGGLYLTGLALCIHNVWRIFAARPRVYESPIQEAPALARGYADPPSPRSRVGSGAAPLAHAIDVWWQGAWHRRWERLPMIFTFWVIVAVVAASLFEIIPTFLIRNKGVPIETVTPYTPLELAGRDLYVSEGCYNCHSQMIRPMIAEVKRYGEYSKPGEFVYDHPFQWGSRRIGPDLARGGPSNGSALWHIRHFEDPNGISPGSVMPPYPWLMTTSLDFESIAARVEAMSALGAPYSADERKHAVALARAQAQEIAKKMREQESGPAGMEDKQVIALIAYLQRVGKDINKPPPAPEPQPPPAAPPTAEQPADNPAPAAVHRGAPARQGGGA